MQKVGPWVPIGLVFGLAPLVIALSLFTPETLSLNIGRNTDHGARVSLEEHLQKAWQDLFLSISLLKNSNIALSLVAFIIHPVLFAASSSTLSQYASKYFGWSLAETSYLLSPLGVLQLCVLLIVPKLAKTLTNKSGRFRLSEFSKDLFLLRLSLVLIIIGSVIEGMSHSIGFFFLGLTVTSLGSPNGPLSRAVVTAYVEPQQTSRLYALTSMLETGGSMLGGPVLAWCFSLGMSKRGIWAGIPWFYVAGLASFVLVSLMGLHPPSSRD